MENNVISRQSKFLSLILRHKPEQIGICLDKHGWANIDELIERINTGKVKLSRDILDEIVEKNNKKRFTISEDGLMIRANQGHSIKVDLDLKERIPPFILYHGTVQNVVSIIKKDGLKKISRHHVHLSSDIETATKVANRRKTKNVIFKIQAREMFTQGYKFYLSANIVWLTENVPCNYISLLE